MNSKAIFPVDTGGTGVTRLDAKRGSRRVRFNARTSHIAIAKLIGALVDGPHTSDELVEACGLCRTTVLGYLRMLRKEKAVHVARWEADATGRMSLRAYSIGRGTDARKPKRQFDAAEFQRRLRAKRRQVEFMHTVAGTQAA